MKTDIGQDIAHAAACLRAGHLVAIPTETVYGLAANAYDPRAVLKIFEAKQRPSFNPLIVHVDRLEKCREFVQEIPPLAQQLAAAFMPGPLTLLLPKNDRLPELVTAGSHRVAVRIPQHPLCLDLLASLDFPVAAPSANPSGYISPTRAAHVAAQLGGKVAYILDGGESQVGLESTIVGIEADGELCLYRLGGLPLEAIEAITGPIRWAKTIVAGSNPASPGQLSSHYAPRTPLYLGAIESLLTTHGLENSGILTFSRVLPNIPTTQQRQLSLKGDLAEAATQLFASLRELDEAGFARILAEPVPERDLGRAINDRLGRAREDQR
jgi:L-threonylcarbamoyladenylate synthase